MKKIYTLFLVCQICICLNAQQLDISYSYIWSSNQWAEKFKSGFTYNSNCKLSLLVLEQMNANGQWAGTSQVTNYYYTPEYLKESYSVSWNEASQNYSDTSQKIIYTYDNSWKLIRKENIGKSAFPINFTENYYYEITGLKDSAIQDTYLGNVHVNTLKTEYQYNTNQNVSKSFITLTDYSNAANNNTQRNTYTYNSSGKLTEELNEMRTAEMFRKNSLLKHYYDEHQYLVEEVYQLWDSTSNSWLNDSRYNYKNTPEGLIFEDIRQMYNKVLMNWENHDKKLNYYKDCKTLPVTLISFTGQQTQQGVNLNWQTTNEINISHFNIQRKADASGFNSIDNLRVKGGNNAGLSNYIYLDKSIPAAQKLYYRLQIVDKDGSFKYSNLVQINNRNALVSLYPNPTNNILRINGHSAGRIEIYNSIGKLQYTGKLNGETDRINVKAFGGGIYIAKITDSTGAMQTKKFVIE